MNTITLQVCSRIGIYYLTSALAVILLVSPWVLGDRGLAQQPTVKKVLGSAEPELEASSSETAKPAPGPQDDYNRGVPRTSVQGFLEAANKADYERASQYLALRKLPPWMQPYEAAELAWQLKVVFDRALWIDLDLLSTDPPGHADDGLPPYRDRVGKIEIDDRKVEVLLQRVQREDGAHPIGLSHYKAVGTMVDALDRHAEEAYAELDTEKKRKICEKIFKALTQLKEALGTRRPTPLATLCELADATQDEVAEVILDRVSEMVGSAGD